MRTGRASTAEGLRRSAFSARERTMLSHAHSYASCKRGSNEDANRIIRRFAAKGRDIARFSRKAIRHVAQWINGYPP